MVDFLICILCCQRVRSFLRISLAEVYVLSPRAVCVVLGSGRN